MQIKQLFGDEDAVSPVIGVILMVAITVILAAVIASFVLGLGGTEDPAPSPTVEWSADNQNVTIDVTGGDAFEASNMEVDGSNLNTNATGQLTDGNQDGLAINGESDPGADYEVSAGDTIDIHHDGNEDSWEVELIWDPADADPEIVLSNEA